MNSNEFMVEFATDNSASFYGFKLKWVPWHINYCAQGVNTCSRNAHCINLASGHKCKCKKGFEGDGKECTVKKRTFASKDHQTDPQSSSLFGEQNITQGYNQIRNEEGTAMDNPEMDNRLVGNWYKALERRFQDKLLILLNKNKIKSLSKKRPHLVGHIYQETSSYTRLDPTRPD